MIEVEAIEKHFGARRALGPISLRIARGEVVGLLGLNGAGKTTTLRILAGDLAPSAGRVTLDGVDLAQAPTAARGQVGWAPDVPPLDDDASVDELLRFAAQLRGVPRARAAAAAARAMERCGLAAEARTPIGALSHGFRKRTGIAQAIVHEPALVLLDEPASGLDPAQIVAMRGLVRELARAHTVVVSSHLLGEIRETCDRIVLLHEGRVLAEGREEEVAGAGAGAHRIEVVVAGAARLAAEAAIAQVEGVEQVEGVARVEADDRSLSPARLVITATRDVRADVARAVIGAGLDLLSLGRTGDELERRFLDLARGGPAPTSAPAPASRAAR